MSPHPLSSLHVTLAVHHTARASAQGVARSHTTCEGLASAVVCRGRGRRWPITTIPCRPPDVRILPASLRPSSPARRWPSRRAHEHAIVYHPPPSTRPILTAIHLAPCCPPSSPLPPPPGSHCPARPCYPERPPLVSCGGFARAHPGCPPHARGPSLRRSRSPPGGSRLRRRGPTSARTGREATAPTVIRADASLPASHG